MTAHRIHEDLLVASRHYAKINDPVTLATSTSTRTTGGRDPLGAAETRTINAPGTAGKVLYVDGVYLVARSP